MKNLLIALTALYLIVAIPIPKLLYSYESQEFNFLQASNTQNPLKREDLPIIISDATWEIFVAIQNIEYLFLKIDPTWDDGNISKNVSAQFRLTPSEFNIGILIFDSNISEIEIAHEILHAKLFVQGHPFFYRMSFPEHKTIANLENEIQHMQIYNTLDHMGFTSDSKDQKNWKKGIEIMHSEITKIPTNAPQYTLNVIGATSTLGGLLRGIDIGEIRKRMPQEFYGGIGLGVQIFEEVNQYDLTNIEENFKFHIWVVSLLKLTSHDTVIGKLDFHNRKRLYYDPIDGRLLSEK